MSVTEFAEDVYGSVETRGLSDSDHVYLTFRQTVDPGMVNAKFDVTPAKSAAFQDSHTGNSLTDQTLRSHVLNGAAFGARLNNALRKLDPAAALSDDELREALALYACHDLHKTIPAQIRREETSDRVDADKHIPIEEVAVYVKILRLGRLDVELSVKDYRASALSAEEYSGPHREQPSRKFERYRDWIRVMDAAASLNTPQVSSQLEERINRISEGVELANHRIDDTKGLITNLLHTTLVEEAKDINGLVPLVFFATGVLYLTTDKTAVTESFSGSDDRARELTDSFISELRNSQQAFQDPRQLTGNLNDDYQKGRIGIPASLSLLAGLPTAIRSVKYLITERSEYADYSDYNMYSYSVLVGVSGGIFDEEIPSASKGVAIGLQLSTFYNEVFMPLSGGDRRIAIRHMTQALGIPAVGEWVAENTESWMLKYQEENPSTDAVTRIADHMDMSEDDVVNELEDGVSLEAGGILASTTLLGMAFLSAGMKDGTQINEFPLERVLEIAESRLLAYYQKWSDDWDDRSPIDIDSDDTADDKIKQFERDKEGLVWSSFPTYLGQNLEVNGQQVLQVTLPKSKREEYASSTQPHVCLFCNDLLVGSGALDDFESEMAHIGFTHYRPINPSGGEPTRAICPQCDLELTLRNAVYEFPDTAHYVLLAPDYFYSPGDLAIAETVHSRLFLGGDYDLRQLAEEIVTGDQINRWRQVSSIFDVILAGSDDERGAEFQNLVKNYNQAYEEKGALGVYRLDPPRRDNDQITRIPQWVVSSFATIAIAWLTSSRALLTDHPIPTTEFDDFPEMVRFDQIPGPVQPYTGDTVTISLRRHLGLEPSAIRLYSRLSGQSRRLETDDARSLGLAEVIDSTPTGETGEMNEQETISSDQPVQIELAFHTELEVKLQTLASLLTVTSQQYGSDIQRVKTVMDRAKGPFPGAWTILRGDDTIGSSAALHAALVFDTLQDPTMSNRITDLADAGFETLHPDAQKDTNYEYERLFRVARDAISDGVAQNASRDELVDIVAGAVMKAAARTDESRYGEEAVKRERAEEFARLFVDDIYFGICDGEFYELRRHENELASGYNAAMRRREQQFFDEHSDDTSTDS